MNYYIVTGEAGDILNFLTVMLQQHGLSLEHAMRNNMIKLHNREWLSPHQTK